MTETNTFGSLNRVIPDGSAAGLRDAQAVSSAIVRLSAVRLKLHINGEFNGDLYGHLRHVQGGVTNFCVLLNRVGRTTTNPAGYADAGLDVTFDDAAANGDIHLYRAVTNPPAGTSLAGLWQPDGRAATPGYATDGTARTTTLNSFRGADADGEWVLFLADMESGGTNLLVSWELDLAGSVTPAVTWATPADIVYGTALGAGQLNATSPVPGTLTYNPPIGTVLEAGSNQVLTVTFTPSDTNSYTSVTNNVSLTVLKKPLTIAAQDKSSTYGGAIPSLTATYSGFVTGDTTNDFSSQVVLSTVATATCPAGAYAINASGASSSNYSITCVAGTLTIAKAPLTIAALSTNKTYGATVPTFSATYTGFVNGDTTNALTTQVVLTTTATTASPAGTYPITAASATSSNYTITHVPGTLTVAKAPLTIAALSTNKTYGAAVPVLTATYTGFVNGDTTNALTAQVVLTTTATTASPAGTYPITAASATSSNYTITHVPGTLTVAKAPLTIAALSTNKTYGAAVPVLTATYTGFVNGDTTNALTTQVVLTTTATTASPAGTYPITAASATSSNYTISHVPGTLTVDKAPLTIAALSTNKTYGAAVPVLTATYTGFVNGDTTNALTTQVVLTTTATTASPAGTYPITAASATSSNYTITHVAGTLTVAKAPLTIAALSTNKTYGAAVPVLTATYTGFVNGDTTNALTTQVVLTTTATTASPAGTYPITAAGATSSNYTITHVPGTLTVDKAPLTIAALSTNKTYGAAVPVLTATYTGFVNGDTTNALTTQVVLTTTATTASPAGTYPITAASAASSNYTIAHVAGILTVAKAPLTITALSTNKTYGAVVPVFSATYSGFVNGDTTNALTTQVVLTTTATTASPAGTYPITAGSATSSNYTISHVPGTLTVDKAPLTIAALSTNKTYGAAVPVLTATYSGFVNGDTTNALTTQVVLTTTATTASPAGTYPITAGSATSSNYTVSHVPGTLTVDKAPLTIAALSTNKTYGAAVPVLTATYSGFVNGDTTNALTTQVVLTTTATTASPAGTYPITAASATSSNYTISHVPGTLTVNKASLTIAALSTNKVYGASLPVFTATYSGFVNGDTTNALTTQVVLTTTATTASPAGTYPINAGGATSSNYTITPVAGVLTITKAGSAAVVSSSLNPARPGQSVSLTCALSAVAPGAGLPTGTVQFRIDGTNTASASVSGGTATYGTSTLPVGTHTVVAEYAGDGNFTGTTNSLSPVQLVNTPPVAGADSLSRYPTNGVKVTIATLLTNDSDADGDLLTFLSFSPSSANGGTLSSNGNWISYTPAPGFTNTDTFTYTLSDGRGTPVTGTVTILICGDGVWPPNLTATDLGNGSFRVTGDGLPGCTYRIQFTPDMVSPNWQPLGTATANSAGFFEFTDTPGAPQRFYRAVWP